MPKELTKIQQFNVSKTNHRKFITVINQAEEAYREFLGGSY